MEKTVSVLCERIRKGCTGHKCIRLSGIHDGNTRHPSDFPDRYASNQAPSTTIMSQAPSTSTSSTGFEKIFTAALKEYKRQTKTDIASHPLATQLQSCGSSSAIIAVLRTQVQTFDKGTDERWTKWLDPTVNVLLAFSATLSSGVGVVNHSFVEPARDLPSDVRYCRYSHQHM